MKHQNSASEDTANEATVPEELDLKYNVRGRVILSALAIIVLFVLVGGWGAVAELNGAVISTGSVKVDGRAKTIQHREGGIVSEIRVKNGDQVKQGEILVTLDETQARAELGIPKSQLVELRARLARLKAESNLDDEVRFPDDLRANTDAEPILNGELRLFKNARQARDSQKEQLSLRIVQLEKECQGVEAQSQAKKRELGLIEKELEDLLTLFRQKLAPATRVYALQREQTRLSGEHGNLIAQLARLNGQISEIRIQILNLDQTARTEAQREARNAEARIAELREREIAQEDRLSRMEIRAPISGYVHELQVHTVGGVITPAEALMTIVPSESALSIEARISPSEIDQVHIGQTVRLRFTSFNQRTTPEKSGTVSYVSADVTQDAKTRTEYYAVAVKLDADQQMSVGNQPILPGMPVEAFITTSKRTALSYFAKPLSDQFSRALREE